MEISIVPVYRLWLIYPKSVCGQTDRQTGRYYKIYKEIKKSKYLPSFSCAFLKCFLNKSVLHCWNMTNRDDILALNHMFPFVLTWLLYHTQNQQPTAFQCFLEKIQEKRYYLHLSRYISKYMLYIYLKKWVSCQYKVQRLNFFLHCYF